MATLPAQVYRGRNNVVGPASGFYLHVNLSPWTQGVAITDQISHAFRAPMDLRLIKVLCGASNSATSVATVTIRKHSTVVAGGGVALSPATDFGLVGGGTLITMGYSGTETVALVNTTAVERNIEKGEWVFVQATTNASGGIDRMGFNMIFWVTGHVNVLEAND